MTSIRTSVFLLLITAILLVSPVSASLKISGTVKYMATVAPGIEVTFPITLSLSDTDPAGDYGLEVFGFENDRRGGYVAVDAASDTGEQSARPYLSLDKYVIHIEPGTNDVVTATLRVPPTAKGGMYALINIHPSQVASGKGASVTTAINVPVMVTVSGTESKETGVIDSITIDSKKSPVIVTTQFTNTGNHHYYGVKNAVEVTNGNGMLVGSYESDPLVTAIVPGGTVSFVQPLNLTNVRDTYTVYTVRSYVIKGDDDVLDSNTNQFTTTEKNVYGAAVPLTYPAQTPTVETPGFGWLLACIGIICIALRKL
jgi:hypothetical protein